MVNTDSSVSPASIPTEVVFTTNVGSDATITDVNSFLSFRFFTPVAYDATSSFDRPAETVHGLLDEG